MTSRDMKINRGILALGLLPMLLTSVHAIELPDNFVDEAFVSNLPGQITAFDALSPGRIFISEKSGIVRVVNDGNLLEQPFIDLRDIVNDRVDRGLLSVAVHPQFPQSPFVYLLYTFDPPELVSNNLQDRGVQDGDGNRVSRLVRYTADASQNFNVAVADSERVILGTNSTFESIGNPLDTWDTATPSCGPIGNPTQDCLPIDEVTHTIGSLRFGADGSLYVTNGDGASFRSFSPTSQMTYDLDSLRGKVLRINADTGEGLPDNPFFDGDPTSNRSRVVNYGLRNPYSLTIHPVTGVPYVGEVGNDTWEEINGGVGVNFGWPCYEGGPSASLRQPGFEPQDFCQDAFRNNEPVVDPLVSWEHDGGGNAAIIGDFYFGEVFPEEFTGKLFFGDFIKGWLRYADISDPQNVVVTDFATDMMPMVEMRVGADGALYYASITSGEIRRIRFDGVADNPATPTPTPTPTTPTPTPTDGDNGGDDSDGGSSEGDVTQNVSVGGISLFVLAFGALLVLTRKSVKRLLVKYGSKVGS